MFTQPQLSCVVSEGTVLTHHKKRKLDHHHYTSSDVVSSTTSTYESNPNNSNNGGAINYRRQNAHIKTSPSNGNQQSFIRASTIKLLDSYTRCGQKVNIENWIDWLCRAPHNEGSGMRDNFFKIGNRNSTKYVVFGQKAVWNVRWTEFPFAFSL